MLAEAETNKIVEVVKEINLKHIAIIMDGNRRWAKSKHLPTAVGHQQGVNSLKTILKSCKLFGVEYLTVYAFSTENWNRAEDEVNFLMGLLAKTISNELKELHENKVKIKFIGDLTRLNNELREILLNAEEHTKDNDGVKLQIAFNYGSRDELTNAVKEIAQKVKNNELSINDITENIISENLYTKDIPDPDLLIRTGGEKRISNYLLWQLAYSELYVTEEFWPEFNQKSLQNAILEFQNRNRRFGK